MAFSGDLATALSKWKAGTLSDDELAKVIKKYSNNNRSYNTDTGRLEQLLSDYHTEKNKGSMFGEYRQALMEIKELQNAEEEARQSLKESRFNSVKEIEKELALLQEALEKSVEKLGGKTNFNKAYDAYKKALDGGSSEADALIAGTNAIQRSGSENELKESIELLKKRNKLDEESTPIIKKQNEALVKQNRLRDDGVRKLKEGLDKINKTMKEFSDAWAKVDVAASKFSKNIGIGAAGMDSIRKNSIESVAKGAFGVKYNVSADELIGIRENFASTIGRNVTVNGGDMENMAAMSAVMKENANEMANRFENFGLSYTDAAEHAGKMFKQAGAAGISFNKYADNVVKNLSMAQNYTFRNGIRGLESMAKKATAIRLDMNQIANFASKVENIEGAVTTGAQLQVLGGPFAMMSDPLGMLNEGLNDVEGLMDRFTKMVGGLGRFNATTGEIAVSSFNKQRVKAAASAMGMDYGQVMESIQAQGRQNFIGQQISGKGYNPEDIELLKNIATVRNGAATVSWTNAKGELKSKDLNKEVLTDVELEELRKVNQSESDNIKDIAQQLRSWDDYITGAKKQVENARAQILEKTGIMDAFKGAIGYLFEKGPFVMTFVAVTSGFKIVEGLLTSILGSVQVLSAKSGGSIGSSKNGGIVGGLKNVSSLGKTAAGAYGRGAGALQVGKEAIKGAGALGKFAKSNAITGALLSGVFTGIDEFTNPENAEHSTAKKIGRTAGSALGGGLGGWGGAAAGAALGTAILPGVGTVIGGLLGGGLGAWGGSELLKWGGGEVSDKVFKAKGGLLNGPSHAKGGMPILGSNIEVEGGEYVINKKATAKNLGLLSAINNNQSVKARNGGKLVNTSDSPIRPRKMENGGVIVKETKSSHNINNVSAGTLSIPPIDINLNGKITLEGANGRGIDITDELLNDKPFIRKLTKMIEEQIIQNTKGGNVVQKGLY